MIKITLVFLVYCIGCGIGSLGDGIDEVGSSISLPVASAAGIENVKSFSNDRTKRRTLALLIPFDDYEDSGEEHHKSKRCWRARPIRKMRLSFEPIDVENGINRESDRLAQSAKYNFNKPNDNEKRSAEQSEEESWEDSQNREDNSERKTPYLKIIPVKNLRTNSNKFIRTDQGIDDDIDSAENAEDVILKKIKDHLKSNDYNVLALVGKRASYPQSNGQGKLICYCKEANCSGENCQRRTYRPCSRCKSSKPFFAGKANGCRWLDGDKNYYKTEEIQSTDANTPLTLQYPASKKQVIEYPVDGNGQWKENPGLSSSASGGVSKLDYTNFKQNLPVEENRRYQFSYNTPRVTSANPNNVRPSDQYRILSNQVPAKSEMESGTEISGSRIPANCHSSYSGNEYRYGNAHFRPNYNPQNQWAARAHYPSFGKADNIEIHNKNYGTNQQNLGGFIGSSNIQNTNQRSFTLPQSGRIPGSQISQPFGTTYPEMMGNFRPILNEVVFKNQRNDNSFGWDTPISMKAQYYPQQQYVQTPIDSRDYQKKPESSEIRASAKFYREKDLGMENSKEKNPGFDFKARGYNLSTENHSGSMPNLKSKNYNYHDEPQDDNSVIPNYENGSEKQIIDSTASVSQNSAHDVDREEVATVGVNNEPGKYGIPLTSVEQANPLGINGLSETSGVYEDLKSKDDKIQTSSFEDLAPGNQELYDNRNSAISVDSASQTIAGNETSNYDDQTGDTIRETDYRTQLEEPTNTPSNWDQTEDDTTSQIIIQPGDNEDGSSLVSESQEDVGLTAAKPEHSNGKEPGRILTSENPDSQKPNVDDYSDIQVITNGYFTSQAYDDFEDINDEDIPVSKIGSGSDLTQHEINTNTNSNDAKQMESGLLNESVANSVSKANNGDHFDNSGLYETGSFSLHQSGHKDSDRLSMVSRNQLLGDDVSKRIEFNPEKDESLVSTTELKKPNVGCTCPKSHDVIKTVKDPETPTVEVVGKQKTPSVEYKSAEAHEKDGYEKDSLTEEDTLMRNEEVAEEAADDSSSLSAGRKKSEESNEDVSYSENGSIEYSVEDSQKNIAHEQVITENNGNLREHERKNYYDPVGDKPAGFIIENSPTRYFSPNDRVLEYVKKHSQNLLSHSDADEREQRTEEGALIHQTPFEVERYHVTPTMYHKKIHQDESSKLDYQEFSFGSESEEIITEPSKDENDSQDDESRNSYERSEVTPNRELPDEVEEPLIQSPRYENPEKMQLSYCGERNTERHAVVLEKPREDIVEDSEKLQRKIDKSDITELSQTRTANSAPDGNMELQHHEKIHHKVDVGHDDQIYHENISGDEYAKEYRGPEEDGSNEESGSENMSAVERYPEIYPNVDVDDDDQVYHDNISEETNGWAKKYRGPEQNGSSEESGFGNMREVPRHLEIYPKVNVDEDHQIYHDNISEEADECAKEYHSPERSGSGEKSEFENMREVGRHPEIYPKVNIVDDHQIYHDNISEEADEWAEEYSGPEHNGSSEESESAMERRDNIETHSDAKITIADNQAFSKTDELTKVSGSHKNTEGKIYHLGKSDEESSQVSPEHQGMKHPMGASGEIYSSEEYHDSTESNEKSAQTHEPIDISDGYSHSAESTEGSILVGKSCEQEMDLNNGKSEITLTHKSFPPYKHDYADSTDRFKSPEDSIKPSADNRAENLGVNKYMDYDKQDDAELAGKTTSPCHSEVAVQKSGEEGYDNSEKLLDSSTNSNEKVNTFGSGNDWTLGYGQVDDHKNSSPELKDRIDSSEKPTVRQHIEIEDHPRHSTSQDLQLEKPEDMTDQSEHYLDTPDDDRRGYAPDTERKVQDESSLGMESEKHSSEVNEGEFVVGSQSTKCCTKPPEVGDDFGYLGRLQPKRFNSEVNSLGDLVDSDLYYIGDGVKLPLAIKKLKDGSFALSISDKICEQRSNGKCACCVPREGRILQEKRDERDVADFIQEDPSSIHRRAIPDDEEIISGDSRPLVDVEHGKEIRSSEFNGTERTQDHVKRTVRSISMPVDKFAEKYNLILDLNDQLANDLEDYGTTESSVRQNVIQRDAARGEAKEYSIQKLPLEDEVQENEREDVLLSTLHDLIATEPEEVFKAIDGIKENPQPLKSTEDRQEDSQQARYGYQRDNPILDRIKIIKQLQKVNRCGHKYQKDCDDAITQKTELLKIILYWLRDLIESKPTLPKSETQIP